MMWIGEHILSYGRVKAPEEGITALKKVTVGEVQKLAGELLSPARSSLALVMPDVTPVIEKSLLEVVRLL